MANGIENKVVVITGASSGLGAATGRRLAAEGAKVVLDARRADRLEGLVEEIRNAGGEGHAVATDVTRRDDVKTLVDTAIDTSGLLISAEN